MLDQGSGNVAWGMAARQATDNWLVLIAPTPDAANDLAILQVENGDEAHRREPFAFIPNSAFRIPHWKEYATHKQREEGPPADRETQRP